MFARAIAVLAVLVGTIAPAYAHDWYSGKYDPVTKGSCCSTGTGDGYGDCAPLQIEPGVLTGEVAGYRIRLSEDQAKRINPMRVGSVNILVPWDRIQPSPDGQFHLCIPEQKIPPSEHSGEGPDFYCFWAPSNS